MISVLALAVASYTGPAIAMSRVAPQMVAGPKKSSKPAVGMPSLKDLQSMKNWGAKPAPKKKNPSIKLSDDVTTEVARQARRASAAATPALDMLRDAAAKAQKKAEDKIYLRDAEAKIDTSAAAMAARALLLLKDNKVIKKLPEPEPEEPYVPKTYLDRATEEKLPTVPQSTLRAAAAATAGYVLWATLIAPAGAPREDLALTRQLESAQEMAGPRRGGRCALARTLSLARSPTLRGVRGVARRARRARASRRARLRRWPAPACSRTPRAASCRTRARRRQRRRRARGPPCRRGPRAGWR